MKVSDWTPEGARTWLAELQRRGMILGLDRVEALARRLGNPEQAFPSVLIAGTNGKGSVAAMLDAVLLESGIRTGRYTSPHLVDWTERIVVAGRSISEAAFARALGEVHEASEAVRATPFEVVTMAAFWHFRQQGVQRGVVEVGLGGRLDATRLCRADLTVVTAVDLDHTAELGYDLAGIAREKAAIARAGSPLLLGPGTLPVREAITAEADRLGVEVIAAEDVIRVEGGPDGGWGSEGRAAWLAPFGPPAGAAGEDLEFFWRLPLAGDHMIANLNTALAALGLLRRAGFGIEIPALQAALGGVRWPGRLQHVPGPDGRADLVLDVGHNPLAARRIAAELARRGRDVEVSLVCALALDKDLHGVLEPLLPHCRRLVATSWGGERAREPAEIARTARDLAGDLAPGLEVLESPRVLEALAEAVRRSGAGGVVLVMGSHMLVGAVLEALERPEAHSAIWPA